LIVFVKHFCLSDPRNDEWTRRRRRTMRRRRTRRRDERSEIPREKHTFSVSIRLSIIYAKLLYQ